MRTNTDNTANKVTTKAYRQTKKFAVAILLSLCSLVALHFLWLPSGIRLSFAYTLENPIEFEVYWADKGQTWSDYRSVKWKTTHKAGEADVFIPADQIQKIRLDIARNSGPVNITFPKLIGKNEVVLSGDVSPHHLKNVKTTNKTYILNPGGRDPYIVWQKPFECLSSGNKNFSLFYFLLIAGTPMYLVYVFYYYRDTRSNHKETRNPALLNIEALRVLFTLFVLHFHFCRHMMGIWSTGYQGVEFFFILSGYLLALTYKPSRTAIDLAKRNWIRFVPLCVFGGLIFHGGWESFYGIFMIQSTGLAYANIPNGPAWYLGVLFWCSLFYLGLIKLLSQQARNMMICVLSFAACVIYEQKGILVQYLSDEMLRGIACMGIGIVLASCCVREKTEASNEGPKTWYTLAEIATLAYIIISCVYREHPVTHWIFIPISHIILIYLFVTKKGHVSSFFERPVFATLSKYCLAIYLTHQVFAIRSHHALWLFPDNVLLSTCLVFAFSIILGILSHYLVEKPCTSLLSSMFNNTK